MNVVRWLCLAFILVQTENPYRGITHITRTETVPRAVTMHIVTVDLRARGIRFKLTSPGGSRETVRRTTLDFLVQEHAQLAVNSHFFLPFPSDDTDANLVGLAASEGKVYSECENPEQSYAIVARAPALNIDSGNHASIVHCDPRAAGGKHVLEKVQLWNTFGGSAQIVTNGTITIPEYRDAQHPNGLLTANNDYSNAHSWYDIPRARTAAGLTRNNRTLVLFTVDEIGSGASRGGGMTVKEVAEVLLRDYAVYNALNLDGGGSTSLAIEDSASHAARLANHPSDSTTGRPVASSLAIFAGTAR